MNKAFEVPGQLRGEILNLAASMPKPAAISAARRDQLLVRIRTLLKRENAVIIAHYYADEDLQVLADETGGFVADSLSMAGFGHRHSASTLVIAGVRFMGETAKILNPEKRVLMPDLNANCSLDLACPAQAFSDFCDEHPDRKVVVYANTSAEVKARADWVVTSSNAVDIVLYLKGQGDKLIWAPDKHLGHYVQQKTGADMLSWQGFCVVHDEFRAQELQELKEKNPDAMVLVHPESPEDVIKLADVVGSTSILINAVSESTSRKFIVATDYGIFHKMKLAAPEKELLVAPTGGTSPTCSMCGHCPWMAVNSLENLTQVLDAGTNEIVIEEKIRQKAILPIQRMLGFSRRACSVALATT